MKNILNETFNKHLQLFKKRLRENNNFDSTTSDSTTSDSTASDSTTKAVGKFLKNLLLADPALYQLKNRNKVHDFVKQFLSNTKYGDYIDLSNESIDSYIRSAMRDDNKWVYYSSSHEFSSDDRTPSSDMRHPYSGPTTNYGVDVKVGDENDDDISVPVEDPEDPETERKGWEKSSSDRLGYPKKDDKEDDFSTAQRIAYKVK